MLFAFPLKKRYINEDQLPFPEGRAAGIVLDGLHAGDHAEATGQGTGDGMFKAKLLLLGGLLSAVIEIMRSEAVMKAIRLEFLNLPEHWDDFIYKFATPRILGTPLKDLTIHVDTSIVMLATGGLMGTRTAMSLLLGAVVNYFILAPIMIQNGAIVGTGFKAITMWSLWGRSRDDDDGVFVFFLC